MTGIRVQRPLCIGSIIGSGTLLELRPIDAAEREARDRRNSPLAIDRQQSTALPRLSIPDLEQLQFSLVAFELTIDDVHSVPTNKDGQNSWR